MTITISILGLDQIGASLAMSLREFKGEFLCKVYDPDPSPQILRILKPAFDSLEHHPGSCVKDAQVIFLSLPTHTIEQTLHGIKENVRSGAVIICLSPAKVVIKKLVDEILGSSIHFVAMHFLVPPQGNQGLNIPQGDGSAGLFENTLAAIAIPPNTIKAVIDLVTGLCSRLGAVPYFCDMLEMDGLLSNSILLPQLVSSAFIRATTSVPGWQDAGKFAGTEYAMLSSAIAANEDCSGLSHAAISLKEHILRGLDSVIDSLEELKLSITSDDLPGLEKLMENARIEHNNWWSNKNGSSDSTYGQARQLMPSRGEYWKQQLGVFGRKPKKFSKNSDE